MERNDFPTGADESLASGTGGNVNQPSESGGGTQGFTDRARDVAGTTQSKLADVGSTIRERAGTAKDSLADALESGAEKLRQRGQGAQGGDGLAGATSAGSV